MSQADRLRQVLYAEDDQSWLGIFADAVEGLRANLIQKTSEREALEVLTPSFFAVVTDLHLELGNGWEVAKAASALKIPHVRIASETGTPSQTPPPGVEVTDKNTAMRWLMKLLQETP